MLALSGTPLAASHTLAHNINRIIMYTPAFPAPRAGLGMASCCLRNLPPPRPCLSCPALPGRAQAEPGAEHAHRGRRVALVGRLPRQRGGRGRRRRGAGSGGGAARVVELELREGAGLPPTTPLHGMRHAPLSQATHAVFVVSVSVCRLAGLSVCPVWLELCASLALQLLRFGCLLVGSGGDPRQGAAGPGLRLRVHA